MSLSSKKPDNVENDHDSSSNVRLPVRILDDGQWLLIRKSFRMSPRELIVAKFVCGGLSNEEIATRLGIKTATIKTHLRNIYRRIRVQRKLDMLLMFLDQSAKYSSTHSDVSISAVDAPTAREIGNKGNFAGR
jgi:DNA-binding CsgD family transcriptional regulator